uniref:hypothetical protein n=1 Tax=Lamprocystis purpurea TaxID=61598 RepID=UPI001B7F8909
VGITIEFGVRIGVHSSGVAVGWLSRRWGNRGLGEIGGNRGLTPISPLVLNLCKTYFSEPAVPKTFTYGFFPDGSATAISLGNVPAISSIALTKSVLRDDNATVDDFDLERDLLSMRKSVKPLFARDLISLLPDSSITCAER